MRDNPEVYGWDGLATAGVAGHKSCSGKSRYSRNPEFGNIVPGVFTPVLAKHTKSFNLIDTLAVGVDGSNGTLSRCSARWNCGGRRRLNADYRFAEFCQS